MGILCNLTVSNFAGTAANAARRGGGPPQKSGNVHNRHSEGGASMGQSLKGSKSHDNLKEATKLLQLFERSIGFVKTAQLPKDAA